MSFSPLINNTRLPAKLDYSLLTQPVILISSHSHTHTHREEEIKQIKYCF